MSNSGSVDQQFEPEVSPPGREFGEKKIKGEATGQPQQQKKEKKPELPPQEQTGILVSSLSTEQEAAEYLAAIRERLAARHNGASPQAVKATKTAAKKGIKKASKKAAKKGGKASKKGASKKR